MLVVSIEQMLLIKFYLHYNIEKQNKMSQNVYISSTIQFI